MNQANASDERLMGEVARGKREHLETLVRRYASPLLTHLRATMPVKVTVPDAQVYEYYDPGKRGKGGAT